MKINENIMEVDIKKLLKLIIENKRKLTCIFTGCGFSFTHYLCANGGVSSFLNKIEIPYSMKEIDDFFGVKKPKNFKHVSQESATAYAAIEFEKLINNQTPRTLEDLNNNANIVLSLTGQLVKVEGERKDRKNIVYGCITDTIKTMVFSVQFYDKTSRKQQELTLAYLVCKTLMAFIYSNYASYGETNQDYNYRFTCYELPSSLYSKNEHRQYWSGHLTLTGLSANHFCFIPGSFNPIHNGHKFIINTIKTKYPDIFPVLELSVTNIEKPMLLPFDLKNRYISGLSEYKHIITNHPWMYQKLYYCRTLFPSKQFSLAIGSDTWNRILETPNEFLLKTVFELARLRKIFIFKRKGYEPLIDDKSGGMISRIRKSIVLIDNPHSESSSEIRIKDIRDEY